ncbi:MAG: hypothetical protein IK104_07695 [Clostridia bacterium]|nr:hypothetical protein [Clostridia bacterium]
MSRTALDVKVKCPFFVKNIRALLVCEGAVPGTCMTTRFADPAAKVRHIEACCNAPDGGGCPLAGLLFGIYEDLPDG